MVNYQTRRQKGEMKSGISSLNCLSRIKWKLKTFSTAVIIINSASSWSRGLVKRVFSPSQILETFSFKITFGYSFHFRIRMKTMNVIQEDGNWILLHIKLYFFSFERFQGRKVGAKRFISIKRKSWKNILRRLFKSLFSVPYFFRQTISFFTFYS